MDLRRFRSIFGQSRFCGLRLESVEAALDDPRVLDALVDQLQVPGKTAVLKALGAPQKFEAILERIESYRKAPTSIWYEVPAGEVLAASIWRAAKLADRVRAELFAEVKKEADLLQPVAAWLTASGLRAYDEIPLGRCRVDVLGHRPSGFLRSEQFVAVELKDDDQQLKRALDQLATFGEYAHLTYLAVTPALIADHLDRHCEGAKVPHWDGGVLYRKLEDFGFGLLVVEKGLVHEFLKPQANDPSDKKLAEVDAALASRKPR
jgi:hypothetical protein